MNKEQVKQAILKVAGFPESGAIYELADDMAESILEIDQPEVKNFNPVKETRVIEAKDPREINY